MVNYEIDPSILTTYLPKGVELDYYQGKTYVSLVGFLFKETSIFNVPIPKLGTFEEVNLRFYVVRKDGDNLKRGVVFINETVPNKIVAWVANKLYKEHYTAIPTRHQWSIDDNKKEIHYEWKVKNVWHSIKVNAHKTPQKMEKDSFEAFIFEHYFGYTRVNPFQSIEYAVNHPIWEVNPVKDFTVDCDFETFYGKDFGVLNSTNPHSVMLAEGSDISVDWRRVRF